MSAFFPFTLKIMSIEPFEPDITERYDSYELPAGYGNLEGFKIDVNPNRLKILSVMISAGRIVKCPVDATGLEFSENDEIKVIMSGVQIACLVNLQTKSYVYFRSALRRRFIMPRVIAGINTMIITLVAGYFLSLIASHQKNQIFSIAVEGVFSFFVVSSIIYAIYYFLNEGEAHEKLRQYLKKILK